MSRMNSLIARYKNLTSPHLQVWYAIPLRLIIGFGFIQHGYAKIAAGPGAFIHILQAVGTPAPSILGWATIFFELLSGLAVFVGAFIPLASIPMAIVLLSATFTVQLHNWFSSIKLISVDAAGAHFGQPGYETNLLYLCGLVALVLGGSGPLSVEQFLLRSHERGARHHRDGDERRGVLRGFPAETVRPLPGDGLDGCRPRL
jgi:putative oxidoreductase